MQYNLRNAYDWYRMNTFSITQQKQIPSKVL